MKLENKIAIVTGAGSGIGKAIAVGMAKEGASLVLNDISEQSCQEISRSIESTYKVKVLPVVGDVSLRSTAVKIKDETRKQFGRIDILVNNAGIMISGLVLDYKEEDWDRIFLVNAKSVFLMCQEIGRMMVQQKYGKIINISSIGAKDGAIAQAAYAATKAAVMNFSRALSKEFAPYKINVNSICPGVVETPLGQVNLNDPVKRQRFIEMTPKGRISVPEDLAGLAVFLASDDSDFIVGQAINVDGGILYY
ncbi:MAG: SDR family NAD(P)-dependent oxidoreductase [Candidatus Atribacteria bacterium]|nr:SDR family NAD(P)-dependent oxidoreductase [Candidatus Atribacteria bacterium]